jgi:hypothetical protein
MKRIVQAELLDMLPPDGSRAQRSRRDLRLVNTLMRNPPILSRALRNLRSGDPPRRMIELGAGDGQFLLRVARELAVCWPAVEVTLMDQHEIVANTTLAEFAALGWRVQVFVCDVREWARSDCAPADVIVANLFLHHFEETELAQLLQAGAARARTFAAVEPRRGAWPLLCSRLLWAIGCNRVTSHDAPVSVHAGFAGRELSALWPQDNGWELMESRAGPFSHLFTARRMN